MISKFSKFESLQEKKWNESRLLAEGFADAVKSAQDEYKQLQKEVGGALNDDKTSIINHLRTQLNKRLLLVNTSDPISASVVEDIIASEDTKILLDAATELSTTGKYSNTFLEIAGWVFSLGAGIAAVGGIVKFVRGGWKWTKMNYPYLFKSEAQKLASSGLDRQTLTLNIFSPKKGESKIIQDNDFIQPIALNTKSNYTPVTLKQDIGDIKISDKQTVWVDNNTGAIFTQDKSKGKKIITDVEELVKSGKIKYAEIPKTQIQPELPQGRWSSFFSQLFNSGSDDKFGKVVDTIFKKGVLSVTTLGGIGFFVYNFKAITEFLIENVPYRGISDITPLLNFKELERNKEEWDKTVKTISSTLEDAFLMGFSNSENLGLSTSTQMSIKNSPGWSKYANGSKDTFSWKTACNNDVKKIGWAVLWLVSEGVLVTKKKQLATLYYLEFKRAQILG
jgi:hypothetical protein